MLIKKLYLFRFIGLLAFVISYFAGIAQPENCKFYLKYPPLISSFYNTADSYEKVRLYVKKEYSSYIVELNIKLSDNRGRPKESVYVMYDDGTHGDSIANDQIYTNNSVLFPHQETNGDLQPVQTMILNYTELTINYYSGGSLIHSDSVGFDFWNVNSGFLANLVVPEVKYLNSEKSVAWADNFIFINKFLNWHELNYQQHGSGCWFDYDYINSESVLYDYWDKSQIINLLDNNFYLQLDFIEPSGQYAYIDGERVYIPTHGIQGPLVHELTHRWIPAFNSTLGIDYSESFGGHHPGLFKNTSGFLEGGYGSFPMMHCEDLKNSIVRLNDSTYYFKGNWTCNKNLIDRQLFNDYELYLMNLIPIDSVRLPLLFANGIIKSEYITDPVTGLNGDYEVYFKKPVWISKSDLMAAKMKFLNDHQGDDEFLSGDTLKAIPVFNWTSNPTANDLKIINFFCQDLGRKGPSDINKYGGFLTYYQATKGKGIIVSNVPKPQKPIVRTRKTEFIDTTFVVTGGEVITFIDDPIVERGVCINKSGTPTIGDSKLTSGNGVGVFENKLNYNILCPDSKYYVRAFATNKTGLTGYGEEFVFITPNRMNTVKENVSICQGENYNGRYTPGIFQRSLLSKSGCDSLVITNLTIYPSYQPKVAVSGDTLKSVDRYVTYQWYNETGLIAGAIQSKYVINKGGKYHLVINDDNKCTNASEVISAIHSDTKISRYEDFRYSILPNPNSGQFIFRVDSNPGKELKLKLLNPMGQVIETRELKSVCINYYELFNISQLNKGIYFLIISTDHKYSSEKIIVQ